MTRTARLLPLVAALLMAAACSRDDAPQAATDSPAPAAPSQPDAPDAAPAPEPSTPAPAPEPTPAAGIPAAFHGAWAADATACTQAGHESRLRIEALRVAFHESSGPVVRATQAGDTLDVTLSLTGEGETREVDYRFSLSADGSTLTDVGNGGMARVRCPS